MADRLYKFHIGIDVSKHKLDIAISNKTPLLQFANNEAGLKSQSIIYPLRDPI